MNSLQEAQLIFDAWRAADRELCAIVQGTGAHGDVMVQAVDREVLGALSAMPDARTRVRVDRRSNDAAWMAWDEVVLDGPQLALVVSSDARPASNTEIAVVSKHGVDAVTINVSRGALCPE